jgi:hypothetical protein
MKDEFLDKEIDPRLLIMMGMCLVVGALIGVGLVLVLMTLNFF